MTVMRRLREQQLILPEPPKPLGTYVPAVVAGGMHPKQTITVYVSVPSADKAMAKVKKLGGTVCAGKTAVPGMGYFAICADQEENVFALWEPNEWAA